MVPVGLGTPAPRGPSAGERVLPQLSGLQTGLRVSIVCLWLLPRVSSSQWLSQSVTASTVHICVLGGKREKSPKFLWYSSTL